MLTARAVLLLAALEIVAVACAASVTPIHQAPQCQPDGFVVDLMVTDTAAIPEISEGL